MNYSMKKSIILIASFFFLSLTIFSQTKNDFFGYYTIVKPPKVFRNISELHLAGNYGPTLNPPFYGLIRLKKKNAKDFKLYKPSLKGKHITFKSYSVNGFSYRFNGYFSRLDDFPGTQPNGEILLKGKLTKYWGNKAIVTKNLKFSYYAGH